MFQFPANPIVGQAFTPTAGVTYKWNGTGWAPVAPAAIATILPSPRNLMINPNWLIDQINEGALYTVTGATVQGPDGWSGAATGIGAFKLRTVTDPDNAALRCLEITCTVADGAIAAGDKYEIFQGIEGYDVAPLKFGTATPDQITVQFSFKSNVLGTYGLAITNNVPNRRYTGSFVVADAAEHEYTLTLTGDTTGAWNYAAGSGIMLHLTLAAGTNFQAAAGSWGAGAQVTVPGQVNFMSAITSIAFLKRIQILQGNQPQPFQPADYFRELAKCQRYYEKSWSQGTAVGTLINDDMSSTTSGPSGAANLINIDIIYKVPKRAVPVSQCFSPVTGVAGMMRDFAGGDVAAAFNASSAMNLARVKNTGAGSASALHGIHWTANIRLS